MTRVKRLYTEVPFCWSRHSIQIDCGLTEAHGTCRLEAAVVWSETKSSLG